MSVSALCPACTAPVSATALCCAFCDHQIRAASAREAPSAASRRSVAPLLRQIGAAVIKRVVALALLLLLLAGGALAGLVVLFTRNLRATAAGVSQQTRAALAARTPETSWPALEAWVERTAELPLAARGAVADPTVARMLTSAAMREQQRHNSLWDADTALVTRLGVNQWKLEPGHVAFGRVAKMLPGPVPDSVLRRVARDTISPWLGVWRSAARSGPMPSLWMYRAGFPGVQSLYDVPIPGYGLLKVLATRNGAAGVLAAARGDTATALLRARENMAVGLHLMREPAPLTHVIGRTIARDAARFMSEIGRAAGDSALQVSAARLDTALHVPRLPALAVTHGWGSLATDPAAPEALSLLSNPALSPGERGSIVQGVPVGGCLSAREILFGFDRRRADALGRSAEALAGTDAGTARMAELSARTARAWSEDAESAMAGYWSEGRKPKALRALDRVGLGGVSARLTICAFMPRYWS